MSTKLIKPSFASEILVINLTDITGTIFEPVIQTGPITLATSDTVPGAWCNLAITANGSAITIPASWLKNGGDDISIVNADVNYLHVICLASGVVLYTNKSRLNSGRTFSGNTAITGNATISGEVILPTVGTGIAIKEGVNAKMGIAVLVAGAVTVNTNKVTANSRIFLTSNVDGGTVGFVRVSARVAGTSFTITSSSGTDTSSIAWIIIEPSV